MGMVNMNSGRTISWWSVNKIQIFGRVDMND